MRIAFTRYSRNRWTAYGSPNRSDWVEIDFAGRRRVSRLELYLWGDGTGVKAPKRYSVQFWDGRAWADAQVVSQKPGTPEVSAVNTVRIVPVEAEKIRVLFQHDLPAYSGMTELVIWEDSP